MPSRTVTAYIDPHAQRLVDAINKSPFGVETFACCSGHYHKPGMPYVAFQCWGWEFIDFALTAVTELNAFDRSQTRIKLSGVTEGLVRGKIEWVVHPSLVPDPLWSAVITGERAAPRRQVSAWWRQMDELAEIIEGQPGAASGRSL